MKNNKGFTLVELLVIIVLLGVVAIIAFGSLNKGGDNAKQALLDNKLENIENAAVLHGQDNKDKFTATCENPEDECCKVCNGIDNCTCYSDGGNIGIKVEELINAGVLKPDQDSTGEIKIKNPINNTKLDEEKVIIYQKYDKIYATMADENLKSAGSNGGSYKPTITTKVGATLANTILANGATYVSSWTEGKSYYHGKECGVEVDCSKTYGFKEFTIYTPNGTKNEKLLKTVAFFGESNDNGLFKAEDDYGTTYYFKGSIINNYVNFAGLNWRIVRINGDGSVRLILADTIKNLGVGEDSKFNILYGDEAYVGYMYGTPNSNNYDDTHKNINDSTIKTKVDLFYETYLKNDYSNYLSDTLFCANKELNEYEYNLDNLNEFNKYNNTQGNKYYSDIITLFFGSFRDNNTISFKCAEGSSNVYSRYTSNSTETSKGIPVNNDLDYPIGLLSYEEYNLAGGEDLIKNNKNYLISEKNVNSYLTSGANTGIGSNGAVNVYWLMSPFALDNYNISFEVDFNNKTYYNVKKEFYYTLNRGVTIGLDDINYTNTNQSQSTAGVRPVINIKPDIKVKSGDGTKENPYAI